MLLLADGTEKAFTSMQAAIRAGDAAGVSVTVFYDWLNYNSTGATTTVSVKSDCTATTSGKTSIGRTFPTAGATGSVQAGRFDLN